MMAGDGKPRRRYTDDDRANALAALAANGGNVKRTAEQLGIPLQTLHSWASGARHPEASTSAEPKKGPMADRLEEIAWQLLEAIPGKIANAPLSQVATGMGIAIDKARLLRGEPTQIAETRTDARLALLRERYAVLDGPNRLEGKEGANAGPDAPAPAGGDAGAEPLHPAGPDGPAAAVPAAGVP
jgi:transposase-like protein